MFISRIWYTGFEGMSRIWEMLACVKLMEIDGLDRNKFDRLGIGYKKLRIEIWNELVNKPISMLTRPLLVDIW